MNNKKNEIEIEQMLKRALKPEDIEVPESGLVKLLNSIPSREAIKTEKRKTLADFILFKNWKLVGTFAILFIAVVFAGAMFIPKQKTIPTPANNVSDAAIDKDLNNIDNQLAGLNSDSQNIDQSLDMSASSSHF